MKCHFCFITFTLLLFFVSAALFTDTVDSCLLIRLHAIYISHEHTLTLTVECAAPCLPAIWQCHFHVAMFSNFRFAFDMFGLAAPRCSPPLCNSTRYSTHTRVLFHVLPRIWLNIAISLTRDYCCLIFLVPEFHRGVTDFFAFPSRPSKRAFWLNARQRYTLTQTDQSQQPCCRLLEQLAFLCSALGTLGSIR